MRRIEPAGSVYLLGLIWRKRDLSRSELVVLLLQLT